METIDLINVFVKMLLISFFIYLTYEKIINYRTNNINYIKILIISAMVSVLYIILDIYVPTLINIMILYSLYGLIINKIVESEINYVAYILACVISYTLYLVTIAISGIALALLLESQIHRNPINLIIIPIVFCILFKFVFTRRRFKNGFNFLKNKDINKNIKKFVIFWIGVTIIIFAFLLRMKGVVLRSCIVFGIIFIFINILIWIKSQITKTYKTKMRDRTIEIQKTEIDEKSKMIEEIKTENLKFATAIHKYNHKFEALQLAMKNALKIESKTEFANEISVILKETEDASKNFAKATEVNMAKLPETNIPGIDNMFEYMQEEATKNNINFDLKLNTSINPLIDNLISKEKFEILIGDHLKDAIIAVNSSEKSYKSILVILGLVDGFYEFSVYDTGVEFEIDTLLKLGKEQVTTHKETGGSGIGFMTTFETLKECKASLVIEEYNPETTSYTKSVTIRFDGKNKYKICSYRAEKIKEQKTKRRIIIQKLK